MADRCRPTTDAWSMSMRDCVNPVLLVHGGAGALPESLDAAGAAAAHAALARALRAGHGVLAEGGSPLDAVVAAVSVLEDAPAFNAGHGAV